MEGNKGTNAGNTVKLDLSDGRSVEVAVNLLTIKLLNQNDRGEDGKEIPGTRLSDYDKRIKSGGADKDDDSLSMIGKIAWAIFKSNGIAIDSQDDALALLDMSRGVEQLGKVMNLLENRMAAEKKSAGSRVARRRKKR